MTETQDRYGRLPEAVQLLFDYARLRLAAEDVGVISIDKIQGGIGLKLSEKARVDPVKLLAMVGEREGASFAPSGMLRLVLSEDEKRTVLETARAVLLNIRAEG
jgi:transcription-repair coupling factor (superfamily II helicase)